MIEPGKLFQLKGGQKRRKLALTYGALERDILGIAEKGTEYSFTTIPRAEYIKEITKILLSDPKLAPEAAQELNMLLAAQPIDELRVCNCARNHLLAIIGTFPAEWDLVIAPHAAPTNEDGTVRQRDFFPGVAVYAEDIRSPFNMGSIFRTAEAMGAEKVYISPCCVDPEQPRAVRSGMGCIETMGWTRTPLDELPKDIPVFALETGGTDINEFKFPKQGICIIGSEELGVSPEALKKADYGRVTIPMKGLKASLNVGVAFGILMQKWVESLYFNCSERI
ncbi:MAG: TrmH family RNA methyltransferase [Treponema sp.]|nr:TrmH family RNA methyltransferase [Treponema sp.]